MDKTLTDNLIPDFPDGDFLFGDDAVYPSDDFDLDRRVDSLLAEWGSASDIFSGLSDAPSAEDIGEADAADDAPLPEPEADTAEVEDAAEPIPEPDEADNPILNIRDGEEEIPELESAYIRRVAAREAHKSRSRKSDAEPAPDADADGLDLDEMDAAIDAELDALFDEAEQKERFSDRLKAPLIRFLATRKMREKLREQEAASWPAPVDIRQTPELSLLKASRYYGAQLRPTRLRLVISSLLTLICLWIGCGLPMAGSLGQSTAMQAAVSLVFLLASAVCALDIVSAGLRQLFAFQLSLEALCAPACFLAAVDSVLVLLGRSAALPYCAPACLSLCAALWANYFKCIAACSNLKSAALGHSTSVLTVEEDVADGFPTLIRSAREKPEIVRRSEDADGSQIAYSVAAPIFLILSVALGILSTIGSDWWLLIHHISAYLCICAGASGFFCFALPYLFAIVQLRQTGSAIAGWPGCADIGRCHRVIITDTDMFPKGTIHLSGVSTQEGVNVEKIVSYLVSLLTASGSSVTEAFDELMARRHYSLLSVEDFKCHDGGGLSAYIHGEYVLAGSSGFLNLMGIRLPQDLNAHNAICIAISNELVGVFDLQYVPVKGVRYALNLLMQGRTQPVFAIRDFNITPLMIQELFQIPAINFEFPSFRERYRLSALYASRETPPAAILNRPGVRCAVETAEIGRRLYIACILNTVIAMLSAVIGMFFVFSLLQRSGTLAVGCGKMTVYALLWLLPSIGIGFWCGR